MNVLEFQQKWRASTLKERSAAQEHFLDLCALLGVPTPAHADPNGDFYTFERGAEKTDGGQGWADVWFRGHFAWEYKGQHADLRAAYRQLLTCRTEGTASRSSRRMVTSQRGVWSVRQARASTPSATRASRLAA
jgi:hypothetical protein